jgi:23S rRNA (adenine2503-C2)-methyltransferase
MCDSGTYFHGNLTKEEIFGQIEHVFKVRSSKFGVRRLKNHPKLKVQFARMGEPSFNTAVLDVLEEMPERYKIKGLMPCVATAAPSGNEAWFDRLMQVKEYYYNKGRFQLQFSINSTDETERDRFMPMKKWRLCDIARYGAQFYKKGDRKVVLNFALANGARFESGVVGELFDPNKFILKITPVNPTELAVKNGIGSILSTERPSAADDLARELDRSGFETIISIGNDKGGREEHEDYHRLYSERYGFFRPIIAHTVERS